MKINKKNFTLFDVPSNKGITLTSLIIYITIMFIVLAIIMRVGLYFKDSINKIADTTLETEFEKLNLYFLNETKKTGNDVDSISEQEIVFTSGNKYSYNYEDKVVYFNDDIKVCEQIDYCLFEQSITENGKTKVIVTVNIQEEEKVMEYILSENIEEEFIDETNYTYSGIYKEYTTTTNKLTIKNSLGKDVKSYKIEGNSIQEGTPTPFNPIEIQSVGDLITNKSDENYGKYVIPITVSNNEQSETVNIYLNEPLRGLTYRELSLNDYIDFEKNQIVRNIKKIVIDGTENWRKSNSRDDYDEITIRLINVADNYHSVVYNQLSNQYSFFYALWNYGDRGIEFSWKLCMLNNNLYLSFGNSVIGVTPEDTTDERTEKVKTFLQEHNFYILQTLKEPIIQNVNLPKLPSYKGETTYTIGTTTSPSSFQVKEYINDL